MQIEYLFSTNNKIGSKIISWFSSFEKGVYLEKYPSHIAVLLDSSIVIESTLFTGVRIIPYTKWLEINIELARIPCLETKPSTDIFPKLTNLWSKSYDWMGIFYFGLQLIKSCVKKEKLPEKNLWQDPNKYFCTEFVAILTDSDFSMHTPSKVLYEWRESKEESVEEIKTNS